MFDVLQAITDASKGTLLSDICIGTSAAPTFFPAYHFETKDAQGNTRDFHLVDGGIASNNPVWYKPLHSSHTEQTCFLVHSSLRMTFN